MKSNLGLLRWIIVTLFIVVSFLTRFEEEREVNKIRDEADHAARAVNLNEDQNPIQNGRVDAVGSRWHFTTDQLQQTINRMPMNRRHFFYTWSDRNKNAITGSASGVDEQAYFVNSFLLGYKPFSTKSIWEPLATLALRKKYVLDHKLYGPNLAEVWQNSKQAYAYTRGDCEDHAIILADWLIAEGHKARVVLGQYDSGGHAWVVLFKGGKEYILEATSKRRPRSINDFILAATAIKYRPMYQFDRKHFWVNTGSQMTTRYRDKKWQLRSTFKTS